MRSDVACGRCRVCGDSGCSSCVAAGDEARAHRRRRAEQHQQQERVAPEVADQREVLVVAEPGQRPVVVDARDRLHAPAVAMRPGPCGRRSWHGRCSRCRSGRSEWSRRSAGRTACWPPTASRRRHRAARGRRTGGPRVSSCTQACASACAPVISSSCDSLKSVVMCGCVSAEPSAAGCGVSASAPLGSTRRLSFSMPRRMPRSRSGVNWASRSLMRFKSCPLCRAGGRFAWSVRRSSAYASDGRAAGLAAS